MKYDGLSDSFNYSIEGFVHTLRTQRNMKIHFFIAFMVLLASLFLDISKIELIIIFFSISLVIAMELVNTAVEVIIDMITPEYRFRAKIAKNISAAAVLMAAINALIVAYLIIFEKVRGFSLVLIQQIKQDPTHMIFINIGLIVIVIITLKAVEGRGTPLEGGMPSGHSALAFSIATMAIFLTEDILIATLVLFMSFLVAHSRLQSKTHNLLEVIAGALIGILFTLFIIYLI
ncbi:MAG: diacylglycerol kinase [Halanaerobiales bacterium]